MYIPKHALITDRNEIFEIMVKNSFGILATFSADGIKAVHIPMMLLKDEGEFGTLCGHISAANDLMDDVSGEALAIFSGPHCYVSPSWYETARAVPTWNYVAVHAYGKPEIIEDFEGKANIARMLVQHYEDSGSGYSISALDEGYFGGLVKGTRAFRMKISRLEGKKKLSQNHPAERQELVMKKLEESDDTLANAIAVLMRDNISRSNG
ncbi:MAG: FMN-binding negative transcriptional regulator [Ignavibacteria bacterium]|nr:FMN-binding negative transcriptional regulator [Ignavibacteria bacterium]